MESPATAHHFNVSKTARYYLLGKPGAEVKTVWFVIHGYGMLAADFIKHFERLQATDTLVVAPEGLSRFYTDRKFEKVGATWMTKEDRLLEIEDHVVYLNSLFSFITEQLPENITVNLIGFSQGAATLYRWVAQGIVNPDNLIFWTGTVPEESQEAMTKKLAHARVFARFATADEFIPVDRMEAQKKWLQSISASADVALFEGRHEIVPQAFDELLRQMKS